MHSETHRVHCACFVHTSPVYMHVVDASQMKAEHEEENVHVWNEAHGFDESTSEQQHMVATAHGMHYPR